MNYLKKNLGNRKIIWLEESNNYLLVDNHAAGVIERILTGGSKDEVADWCGKTYELPENESSRFVGEIIELLGKATDHSLTNTGILRSGIVSGLGDGEGHARLYRFNHTLIEIRYCHPRLEELVHPRFSHLEVRSGEADHVIEILHRNNELILLVDHQTGGIWEEGEAHLLLGRLFFELVRLANDTDESNWMGVFHASAVSYHSRGLMFLGDSGKGKSTATAILLSEGFTLCADDFVPVDSHYLHLWSFPAALSLKKESLETLMPLFPQLSEARDFFFPESGKTVRYLTTHASEFPDQTHVSCEGLIFVNYQVNSGCRISRLPKYQAFSKLVPDSWISPIRDHAQKFLDWFLSMPCYQLTYSDQGKMVQTVSKLFKDV